MWKLIRLEWKKSNIMKYIRNASIMVLLLLILLLAVAEELELVETALSYGRSMLESGTVLSYE
ncbi:MAG: hypothetical protein K2K70_10005, partial [Lachnospiraceae bacterium]|nr:hypothetical protein [Lachnospiraceae bacterium]